MNIQLSFTTLMLLSFCTFSCVQPAQQEQIAPEEVVLEKAIEIFCKNVAKTSRALDELLDSDKALPPTMKHSFYNPVVSACLQAREACQVLKVGKEKELFDYLLSVMDYTFKHISSEDKGRAPVKEEVNMVEIFFSFLHHVLELNKKDGFEFDIFIPNLYCGGVRRCVELLIRKDTDEACLLLEALLPSENQHNYKKVEKDYSFLMKEAASHKAHKALECLRKKAPSVYEKLRLNLSANNSQNLGQLSDRQNLAIILKEQDIDPIQQMCADWAENQTNIIKILNTTNSQVFALSILNILKKESKLDKRYQNYQRLLDYIVNANLKKNLCHDWVKVVEFLLEEDKNILNHNIFLFDIATNCQSLEMLELLMEKACFCKNKKGENFDLVNDIVECKKENKTIATFLVHEAAFKGNAKLLEGLLMRGRGVKSDLYLSLEKGISNISDSQKSEQKTKKDWALGRYEECEKLIEQRKKMLKPAFIRNSEISGSKKLFKRLK